MSFFWKIWNWSLSFPPPWQEEEAHDCSPVKRAGVAAQKWPEHLHQVDDFPRTASGKVQKFLVRQDIAACQK